MVDADHPPESARRSSALLGAGPQRHLAADILVARPTTTAGGLTQGPQDRTPRTRSHERLVQREQRRTVALQPVEQKVHRPPTGAQAAYPPTRPAPTPRQPDSSVLNRQGHWSTYGAIDPESPPATEAREIAVLPWWSARCRSATPAYRERSDPWKVRRGPQAPPEMQWHVGSGVRTRCPHCMQGAAHAGHCDRFCNGGMAVGFDPGSARLPGRPLRRRGTRGQHRVRPGPRAASPATDDWRASRRSRAAGPTWQRLWTGAEVVFVVGPAFATESFGRSLGTSPARWDDGRDLSRLLRRRAGFPANRGLGTACRAA